MSEQRAALSLPRLQVDARVLRLARQLVSFLAVGGIGFVVDAGLFNLLRATLLSPENQHGGILVAKIISTTAAIGVNWVGNRLVTFRSERGARVGREALEFFAASLLGSSVSLVCLGISHYGLDLTSALADNVSANIVGLALGTALRFVLYRVWVFRGGAAQTEP